MGNLRGGSQPFATLKKEVKENLMSGTRSQVASPASAAGAPADADSSAAARAQLPKSRFVLLTPELY